MGLQSITIADLFFEEDKSEIGNGIIISPFTILSILHLLRASPNQLKTHFHFQIKLT